jgi:hypothetical protein
MGTTCRCIHPKTAIDISSAAGKTYGHVDGVTLAGIVSRNSGLKWLQENGRESAAKSGIESYTSEVVPFLPE